MQDKPTAPQLLAAVREFLNQEVVPAISSHRLKFRAMIAANVLSVVERELVGEEERLREEWERLAAVTGPTAASEIPPSLDSLRCGIENRMQALCARIRAGEADAGPWRQEVLNFVHWSVRDKLLVANPRFVARMESADERAPQ